MASIIPVISWITRQRPRMEPKFHQMDRLMGAGRSIIKLFIILINGWDLRKGAEDWQGVMGNFVIFKRRVYYMVLDGENGRSGPAEREIIFTTINKVKNRIVAKKINNGMFLLIRRLKIVGETVWVIMWCAPKVG
jgi:hypothetical protein